MAIKKITCKHATELITKQDEKRLSLKEKMELLRHLASCSLCRLFSKQNKWLNYWLQNDESASATHLATHEKQAMITAMQEGENLA